MGLWDMIVIVVIVGGVVSISQHYISSKNGTEDTNKSIWDALGLSDSTPAERDVKKHLDRIIALEERVKVLERIATDKGKSLRDEIDNLK